MKDQFNTQHRFFAFGMHVCVYYYYTNQRIYRVALLQLAVTF